MRTIVYIVTLILVVNSKFTIFVAWKYDNTRHNRHKRQ